MSTWPPQSPSPVSRFLKILGVVRGSPRGKALWARLPPGGHAEDIFQGAGSPEHLTPHDAGLGLVQALRVGFRHSWEAKLLFACSPRQGAPWAPS